ncbi:class I SAM-dependent methyltransferase [Nonlabens marinus]|uniref:Conserved domain protein n=1 Tax=Nonlabens marinus S1-08 TaxID=1454201 RepID=W8W054_9FLAO|nr:class I SAM-dependent methyltransferase [Nonlabens marinus]BAO55731.1 conserved domain protein [Nonlabens marinus S1-08]
MDNFTRIPFNASNLDRYYIRTSIVKAIEDQLSVLSGKLLDIGCGKMPYKKFILEKSNVILYTGLDIEEAITYDAQVKPDYIWNGMNMPFEDNSYDCALGTEVLEHCPSPEIILNEVCRVLKPGGLFMGTVPFLWPLHEVPHDEYRFTPYALERHLHAAGFTAIEICATGGWHASMAQMLGLWTRRSGLSLRSRKVLSYIIKPIMSKLIKMDAGTPVSFKESQMITGLSFTAKK